ncbi:MAG: fibronectin type III-like domain-contianing protein [Candidatus Acidiferrales bacterium]
MDFKIANAGKRAGAEVAQLYVGKPSSSAVPEPPKELVGFEKVDLQPNQTRHVHLTLDARSLSHRHVSDYGGIVFARSETPGPGDGALIGNCTIAC